MAESEEPQFVVLPIEEVLKTLPVTISNYIKQMAKFENFIDNQESGTPLWDNMSHEAHSIYLTESYRRVMALLNMGWTPPEPKTDTTKGEEDDQ